jgi:hypothetical protein
VGKVKVAVVTPYYREELETLRRCHESVLRQTYDCTHVLVADGHPRPEIAAWDAQHMALPVAHRDYGNTPRGLGGISALNQGFDAIAFLDADNWYAEDHVESLVALCEEHRLAVAFSSRHIILSTGEYCPFVEQEEFERKHVDTSCFFITSKAAFLVPLWAMMERGFSSICDRVMLKVVQSRGISHGWTGRMTLFYESRWPGHFTAMGKQPPPDAHHADWDQLQEIYLPERTIARLGFDPFAKG